MRALVFLVLATLVAASATTACDRGRRARSPRLHLGDGGPEDDPGYQYRVRDGGPAGPAPSITAAPGDTQL